ncbi:MAG: hypothetical protein ACREJD_03490 [Phycisphaerales bacterium]
MGNGHREQFISSSQYFVGQSEKVDIHQMVMNTARLGRRAAIALTLGFAVATCTALACSLWEPVQYTMPPRPRSLDAFLGSEKQILTGWGFSGSVGLGGRGSEDYFKEWTYIGPGEYRAGWPVRMLVSNVAACHNKKRLALAGFDLPPAELFKRGFPTDRLPSFVHAKPERRIPMKPLWFGTVVNTIVWSAFVAGGMFMWTTCVATVRMRLGRCVNCGYSLRELTHVHVRKCPECGTSSPIFGAATGVE